MLQAARISDSRCPQRRRCCANWPDKVDEGDHRILLANELESITLLDGTTQAFGPAAREAFAIFEDLFLLGNDKYLQFLQTRVPPHKTFALELSRTFPQALQALNLTTRPLSPVSTAPQNARLFARDLIHSLPSVINPRNCFPREGWLNCGTVTPLNHRYLASGRTMQEAGTSRCQGRQARRCLHQYWIRTFSWRCVA